MDRNETLMSAAPLPVIEFVAEEEAGERLDRALGPRLPELTRSAIQRLIEDGHARVNNAPARAGQKLRPGDHIAVEVPAPRPTALEPEDIPLDIRYEDEHLLVINKPRDLVVHPAPGNRSGTLVNAVLAHAGDEILSVGGEERPGIVHRLDKDTSGLMVVAKTDAAQHDLQRQIQERTAERRYLAVVRGVPKFERAVVDAPIGRHPVDRKRMAVIRPGATPPGRPAQTRLQVLERFPGLALLEAKLETGRTHQIRVHCAYIGHPVIGDPVYDGAVTRRDPHLAPDIRTAVESLGGQALHAYGLAFDHPATGERCAFRVPPPTDMGELLRLLGSRFVEETPTFEENV
jgi:23S rRNA pseudouridine1911/1915/1917 synthase